LNTTEKTHCQPLWFASTGHRTESVHLREICGLISSSDDTVIPLSFLSSSQRAARTLAVVSELLVTSARFLPHHVVELIDDRTHSLECVNYKYANRLMNYKYANRLA
jgi:hypothetical protein